MVSYQVAFLFSSVLDYVASMLSIKEAWTPHVSGSFPRCSAGSSTFISISPSYLRISYRLRVCPVAINTRSLDILCLSSTAQPQSKSA